MSGRFSPVVAGEMLYCLIEKVHFFPLDLSDFFAQLPV